MAAMDQMLDQAKALGDHLRETQTNAHNASREMQDLSRSVFSYGKALLSLGLWEVIKPALISLRDQALNQVTLIKQEKERIAQRKVLIDHLEIELDKMRQSGNMDTAQLLNQEKLIFRQKATLSNEEHMVVQRQKLVNLVKDNWKLTTATYLVVLSLESIWRKTVEQAIQYNRVLIQADSAARSRYKLISDTLRVQSELGAHTETMQESAQALVSLGSHLTPVYQNNLRLVVMMREGLGVSAHTAAEMAVVFTRQLRQGAEDVANAIARIAANTGLASEKLARFATEIARSLRLIGPSGMGKEAAKVAEVMGTLAGRVNSIGGNADAILNMFQALTGGDDKSQQMRMMARTSIEQMASPEGALTAFKNIVQAVNTRANSSNFTIYRMQLKYLADEFGVTANDLADLRQVVQSWEKDMGRARTAQEAYNEQTRLLGESWKQIKTALTSVMVEAMLPVVKILQAFVGGIRDMVTAVTSFTIGGIKPLVVLFQIAIPVAAGLAIASIVTLGKTLTKFAIQNELINGWLSAKNLPTVGRMGTLIKQFLGGAVTRGGIATAGGTVGGLGTSLLAGGAAAAAGGLIGVGLGTAWDKLDDRFRTLTLLTSPILVGIKYLAKRVGEWSVEWKADKDAGKEWIKANKGGNALQAAWKAADLMAKSRMGGATQAETDAAMADVRKRFAEYGWSKERTDAAILNMAHSRVMDMATVNQYRGFVEKTEGEKALDKQARAVLDTLQLQRDEARKNEEARRNAEVQALAAKAMLNDRSNVHWNMAPPLQNQSKANSFILK